MILLDIIVGVTPREPLKLEVGKFYKTRKGLKVRIYALEGGHIYPIHGATLDKDGWTAHTWSLGGSIYQDKSYSDFDIVGEWKDEVEFDFIILPPWINFIAMDADGAWWGYVTQPMRCVDTWTNECKDVEAIRIPPTYAPKWEGDWKDTLTKRK